MKKNHLWSFYGLINTRIVGTNATDENIILHYCKLIGKRIRGQENCKTYNG